MRIPSLSGHEGPVARFLATAMRARGFARAFVDEAGNAVGIAGAGPRQIVLLGHMDTVGGDVPVRYEHGALYGRGTVDAKGPLCAFVLAVDSLIAAGIPAGWQLIVIGATEEEAATSRGARHAAGVYHPEMCVIGEPSASDGITLGYKGRLLVRARLEQASQHTALPGANASETAVGLWNHLAALAARYNADKPRAFDQILPSLRKITSGDDGNRESAEILIGVRLPPEYTPEHLAAAVAEWDAARQVKREGDLRSPISAAIEFVGAELAWRSPRDTALARAFVDAIRAEKLRPVFKLKTGTADFNVVGPVWGVPIVAYGPGDSSLDHTPHEHVQIDEFDRAVRILADALRRVMTDA